MRIQEFVATVTTRAPLPGSLRIRRLGCAELRRNGGAIACCHFRPCDHRGPSRRGRSHGSFRPSGCREIDREESMNLPTPAVLSRQTARKTRASRLCLPKLH